MQYTKTFKEALALACQQGCPLWADTEGTIFDIDTIVEFAEVADASHPLDGGRVYATSAEGAIGICNGREYDIDWVFYPVEDEAVQAKYIAQYQREVAAAAERARGGNRYCMWCGSKIDMGSKFCPRCGGNQEG